MLTFHKHQNPHQRESPSEIPPPAGGTDRYSDQPVTDAQRRRILSRDGTCQSAELAKIYKSIMWFHARPVAHPMTRTCKPFAAAAM